MDSALPLSESFPHLIFTSLMLQLNICIFPVVLFQGVIPGLLYEVSPLPWESQIFSNLVHIIGNNYYLSELLCFRVVSLNLQMDFPK